MSKVSSSHTQQSKPDAKPRARRILHPALHLAILLSPVAFAPLRVARAQPPAFDAAHLPRAGVRVPFTLRSGLILVRADLAGKKLLCTLDTGSNACEWPRWLALSGVRAAQPSRDVPDGTRDRLRLERVILPSIRLGDFAAQNVATYAVDTHLRNRSEAAISENILDHTPILNSAIFDGTILTIDYERHELLIRPSHFDPLAIAAAVVPTGQTSPTTASSAEVGGRVDVTDFRLISPDRRLFYGVPVVACTYGGVASSMVLDTGAFRNAIGIDPAVSNAVVRQGERTGKPVAVTRGFLGGLFATPTPVDQLPELPFSFLCSTVTDTLSLAKATPLADSAEFETPTNVLDDRTAYSQGTCGWSVLKHFRRISLDFTRHHLVLEEWPSSLTTDENFPDSSMAVESNRKW